MADNNIKSFPKKWTTDEEEQLLQEIADSKDINDIATAHARSVGGVAIRIKEIAYKMHSSNIPIDEISSKTKLSVDEITDIVNKKNNQNDRKSKATNSSASSSSSDNVSLASINSKLDTILQLLKKK